MTERKDDPIAPGLQDGDIKVLSPEEYAQVVAERNAEEEQDTDDEDDLSDLDELNEILGEA